MAAPALILVAVVVSVMVGLPSTAALFTSEYPVAAELAAGQIFPAERDTAAFSVTDASSGSSTNASSATAFVGDGLTVTTSSWATSFAADRYLDFEMNGPLPTGLSVSSSSFRFAFASATAGSTACYYFEVRQPQGTVIETMGSAGSTVACVTGTTPASTTTSLSAIGTTTIANGVHVRVYARDAAAGGTIIDAATVTGDYGLATFTLYPIVLADAADTTAGITRWGPAGP